jgi:hypothetical protein
MRCHFSLQNITSLTSPVSLRSSTYNASQNEQRNINLCIFLWSYRLARMAQCWQNISYPKCSTLLWCKEQSACQEACRRSVAELHYWKSGHTVHNSNHCSGDPMIPTVKGMPATSYVGCMRHAAISTQDKTRCYIELRLFFFFLFFCFFFVLWNTWLI